MLAFSGRLAHISLSDSLSCILSMFFLLPIHRHSSATAPSTRVVAVGWRERDTALVSRGRDETSPFCHVNSWAVSSYAQALATLIRSASHHPCLPPSPPSDQTSSSFFFLFFFKQPLKSSIGFGGWVPGGCVLFSFNHFPPLLLLLLSPPILMPFCTFFVVPFSSPFTFLNYVQSLHHSRLLRYLFY